MCRLYLYTLSIQEAVDFISTMLRIDPKKRATMYELFSHPWLSEKKLMRRTRDFGISRNRYLSLTIFHPSSLKLLFIFSSPPVPSRFGRYTWLPFTRFEYMSQWREAFPFDPTCNHSLPSLWERSISQVIYIAGSNQYTFCILSETNQWSNSRHDFVYLLNSFGNLLDCTSALLLSGIL